MSQFTKEEWDKIISQKKQEIETRDKIAAQSGESFKTWMTPHYDDITCPNCEGKGTARSWFKECVCGDCNGTGKVKSKTPYYNSPGNPMEYSWFEKWTGPALARHELRQLLIKRFVDLNPDHELSIALMNNFIGGLVRNPEQFNEVIINYGPMTVNQTLLPLETPIVLLTGKTYGYDVWGEHGMKEAV